jgi:hypothetical protein
VVYTLVGKGKIPVLQQLSWPDNPSGNIRDKCFKNGKCGFPSVPNDYLVSKLLEPFDDYSNWSKTFLSIFQITGW